MSMACVRRAVLIIATAVALVGAGAGSASAGMPWWHVNTVSAPPVVAGGLGRLVLEVSNLGDAAVNGAIDPVTIVDRLPAGISVKHVYGEGGGSFPVGINGVKQLMTCAVASTVVTCSYGGPLLSYERFMIAMTVEAAPGAGTGLSEVSVTGGGAASYVWRHALALGEAPAPFGVEDYELTSEEVGGAADTQAGSHPFQLTTTLVFNTKAALVYNYEYKEVLPEVQPVALTKDLRFDLPTGLVGNPTALPRCPLAVFDRPSNTSSCPRDTVLGVATPIVTNNNIVPYVPFAEAVPLYNLEPSVGEPARFGFTTPVGPVVLDTAVRTGSDYGVVVRVPNILDDIGFIGSQVTFWGVPGDSRHDAARGECLDQFEGTLKSPGKLEEACPVGESPQPFLIMPTSCTGPLQSSVEGDSWEDIGEFAARKEYLSANLAGEPFGQDGCNKLNFEPSITVAPDSREGSEPSGLTVNVHVDQEASLNPSGLAEASVKDTTVVLPSGVALNPAGADGLSACAPSEIKLESAEDASCPEASKVGTVDIHTPLLPHDLEGAVYLASPAPNGEAGMNPFNSLLALYIVAKDPVSGVLVKLAGEVKPDPLTGQLTSTFDNTPQLPFEDLTLHFFGGSRAPLGTPALCGSYVTSASFSPWSGSGPAAVASPPFEITSGPNGAPCSDPPPFAPALTAGSVNLQADAFTPFTMTMSREDGDQNLDAISLDMPPGISGVLTGVEKCQEASANAGTCGPSSLIGETTVSVGLGSTPYTVTGGKVYLTEGYEGAPLGLSIVNPADAGPFHLGKVVVRAKIEVNPVTAALTVTSDASGPHAIPQLIDGIPLEIKHVNVTIDRPGFTVNPTSCEPTQITGTLTSSQNATSSINVPFQVTNCASLAFKPTFTATTSGKTSKRDGTSLRVDLTMPKAAQGTQANIHEVKVELPRQLPVRSTTLTKACTSKQFQANPAGCPSESIVGHVKALTPVLPVALEGPAYFVSYGGAQFPELVIVLQGYGITIDLHGETYIAKKGDIISSTFKTVPDQPVGSFELILPNGPDSALTNNGDLCKVTKTITVTRTTKNRVKGRVKTIKRSVKKRVPSSLIMPTTMIAQNGAEIHQSTAIAVSGCGKAKAKGSERSDRKARHRRAKK